MVTGIVVTHGNLAEVLLETARTIIGDFSNCYAVTNSSKSPQTLYDEIHALVESEGGRFVVFVDYFGGSCSLACLKIENAHANTCVISGVNLPMLLAFLNKRESLTFDRLTGEIIERGQSSVKILDPSKL